MTVRQLLIIVVLVISLPLGLKLFGPGSSEPAAQKGAAAAQPSQAPTVVTTINGQRVLTEASDTQSVSPSELPIDQLRLSHINYVTAEGATPVLVLTDGSRLRATPYVLERLPSDIRLRATYDRN